MFELKREIITASGLGDGSDFDLHIYPEDQPTTEYDDDTTIISRSSTVIAVRRPAARGHGRAARYVSGRAPVRAIKKTDPAKSATTTATAGAPQTELDAEAAFLAESAQVWDAQKETLSHAKPVFHKKKPVNVPTHDPPPGYVCYRCQKKGHWIQACPTNDDPDFKPAARAKRTTGIPRSFLKTVEKPADGDLEDTKGVMLNAEGEYVMVMTDTKTWEKFQAKTNAAKEKAANVDAANKEMRERGLECPIDKRMFVDPVKTPCCGKTYCHDCIENALADGDLICPNCSTEGVLIDDLVTDDSMVEKIRIFEAEKAKEKTENEKQAQEKEKEDSSSQVQAASALANPSSPKNDETNSVPPALTDETTNKVQTSEMNPSGPKSPKSNQTPIPSVSGVIVPTTSEVKSPLTVAAKPTSGSTSTTPVSIAPPTSDPSGSGAKNGNGSDTDTSSTSTKRKDAPTDIKPPTAPKAMRVQKEQQARQAQDQSSAIEKNFIESMEALKNMPTNMGAGMPMMPNMSMSMGMPMNANMGMMDPSNMNGMNGMGPMGQMNGYGPGNQMGWNGYNNGGYPNGNMYGNMQGGYGQMNGGYPNNMNSGYSNNFGGYGNMNGGMNNQMGYGGGWNQQQQYGMGGNMGGYQNPNIGGGGSGPSAFPNQQRTDVQDAYERKPLNPHRAQNKNRKQRAPDYHYV